MSESTHQVTLTSAGSDSTAAAINTVNSSMGKISTTHSNLKTQFSEKFEHIGLKMFAGDLLRTQGLAGETRPIIGLLMTSMNALGDTFGVAGGPIMLFGAALLALIPLIEHVIDRNTSTTESLSKQVAAHEQAAQSMVKEIASIENYREALGHLPPALQALLDAHLALQKQMDREQESTLKAHLGSIDQTIAKTKDNIEAMQQQLSESEKAAATQDKMNSSMSNYHSAAAEAQNAIEPLQAAIKKAGDSLVTLEDERRKDIASMVDMLHGERASIDDRTKVLTDAAADEEKAAKQAADAEKKRHDAYIAMWDERIAKVISGNQTVAADTQKTIDKLSSIETKYHSDTQAATVLSFNQKNDQTEKWYMKQKSTLDQIYQDQVNEINASDQNDEAKNEKRIALDQQYHDTTIALEQDRASKIVSIESAMMVQVRTDFDSAWKQIDSGIGNSFAKMVVEGQSFSQAMQNLWQNLVETIISDIVQIIVKLLALEVVEQATGVGGFGGSIGAAWGGAMADGGSFVVDKPTMFMAGESGPELASFTPMSDINGGTSGLSSASPSGAAGASSVQNISVGDIHVNVAVQTLGSSDRAQVLDQLAQEIRAKTVAGVRFSNTVASVATQNSSLAF